jgi:hypothetical protein
MTEILRALKTRFDSSATLKGLFPNGLYAVKAKANDPLPQCVVFPTVQSADFNTGTEMISNFVLRFAIYADDGNVVASGIEALIDAYNQKALSVLSGTVLNIGFNRYDIDNEDNDVIQGNVFFEGKLETTIV